MNKMRLFSLITLILVILSGCSNNDNDVQVKFSETASFFDATAESSSETTATSSSSVTETEYSEESQQEIIDAFTALSYSERIDLTKMSIYLVDNINKVSPENADEMLQIYEKTQMQALTAYQDTFLTPDMQRILLTYSIEDLRQNRVKEKAVRALLTEAAAVGYKIEAIEGTIAPYVDYGYFAQFSNEATASTGAFYTLMKEESDHPSQKDAALLIPWADVLQRGIHFEAYLETYPGAFYEDRAIMHLEGYKELALIGSANVPLFEYDTHVMNFEAKAAYTTFVKQQIKTEFAKLIETYLHLLEKHQYIKTSEIEAFINQQR